MRTGAAEDLDRAAGFAAEAADPDLLATIRLEQFRSYGDRSGLDAAVTLRRSAVAASGPDDARHRSMLAVALRNRGRLTGSSADLAEAVGLARSAVELSPPGTPERSICVSNLVAALRTRFERTDDGRDLDEAIRVGLPAVDELAEQDPVRVGLLSNLGNAFAARFRRSGSPTDLDEAIRLAREAVRTAPPDNPLHTREASNLSASLFVRFGLAGDPADLDNAISFGRRAVAIAGESDPARAVYLQNLGQALLRRFQQAGEPADLDAAAMRFSEAAGSPTAAVVDRIQAGRAWAALDAARLPADAALEAQAVAVGLLPLLAWRGISYRDQQHLLAQHAPGVATDGAAIALKAGRKATAVELLESGRGVYWSQVLDARSDLEQLRREVPAQAERLAACRAALETVVPDR
jgi:hypothetical protein